MSNHDTPASGPRLTPAQIDWQQDTPISTAFDDIYFNKAGGLAETEYVFLDGNNLTQRWRQLQPGAQFSLGETGFGTGLNFLSARRLWLETAPVEAGLHYISCEKYPLTLADLRQALAHWPTLADGAVQLLAAWPPACEGIYTLQLDGGRVRLTLLFGDAAAMLGQLNGRIDSWFLDGFAPSRNPQMWSPELFEQIAAHSHAGTRFATFTAASLVRRGLQAVGFQIEKRPGFGRKREMLTGVFAADSARPADIAPADTAPVAPWFTRPSPAGVDRRVIVVGAGLAGACTADALVHAGFQVQVLERHAAPAQEGSGNPQGALYIKLPAHPTRQSELHLAGFHYTTGWLKRLLADTDARQPPLGALCGLLSLALEPKELQRQQALIAADTYPPELLQALDQADASQRAGLELGGPALWFPQGGWAAPGRLCRHLLRQPGIECHFNTPVQQLRYDAARNLWCINGGAFEAPQVVLCSAAEVGALVPQTPLSVPLKPIRGQTSSAAAPRELPPLQQVVCGEGYVSPPQDGIYCFGASFKLHDASLEVRSEEHESNLRMLAGAVPVLAQAIASAADTSPLTGRTAFRATTPDYLPLVGPLADEPWVLEHFAKLRDDANWRFGAEMRYRPGLYVNSGHGAKGLISCPISAQLIAALLLGTPLPVSQSVYEALQPVRFPIKKLIRRSI